MAASSHPACRRAFTLIEMLVAIAVFSVLIVLLGKTMTYAVAIWTRTSASVDNLAHARGALDNLQIDLSKAILRPDLAAFCDATGNAVDANGNAVVAFYAERPGISYDASQRQIGLISYDLEQGANGALILRRTITPVGWSAGEIVFGDTAKLTPGSGGSYTQTLAKGILAWAVKFLDNQGNIGSTYSQAASEALTVSLLAIDDRTDLRLDDRQRIALVAAFDTISGTAEARQASVGSLWQKKLNDGSQWQGYPAGIAGALKVFERTYSLRNSP